MKELRKFIGEILLWIAVLILPKGYSREVTMLIVKNNNL